MLFIFFTHELLIKIELELRIYSDIWKVALDMPENILWRLWPDKLPTNISQSLVALINDITLEALADIADKIQEFFLFKNIELIYQRTSTKE